MYSTKCRAPDAIRIVMGGLRENKGTVDGKLGHRNQEVGTRMYLVFSGVVSKAKHHYGISSAKSANFLRRQKLRFIWGSMPLGSYKIDEREVL